MLMRYLEYDNCCVVALKLRLKLGPKEFIRTEIESLSDKPEEEHQAWSQFEDRYHALTAAARELLASSNTCHSEDSVIDAENSASLRHPKTPSNF
ncbi:unnamed protein product [Arctia plantaginis]|uniref:Uncharacterized protein n=1 Tax=Arctia plantaginis TaxID=874455 RepID=A0A8S0YW03_ARCPL|nr:unnamed protein product [Arctia plantaginis]